MKKMRIKTHTTDLDMIQDTIFSLGLSRAGRDASYANLTSTSVYNFKRRQTLTVSWEPPLVHYSVLHTNISYKTNYEVNID